MRIGSHVEEIGRVVQRDQRHFVQDYLYVQHLRKIYGEESTQTLSKYFDQFLSKIDRDVLEKERERTTQQAQQLEDPPDSPPSKSKKSVQENTEKPPKPEETHQPASQKEEEQVEMPTRTREGINYAQPFQPRGVHMQMKDDNVVLVKRGEKQIRIQSKILNPAHK